MEIVFDYLRYNSKTGDFYWIKQPSLSVFAGSIAGTTSAAGYVTICLKRKFYKAHRLAWFFEYGVYPKMLDHINHNRSDNRMENLRLADSSVNAKNQSLHVTNTSGFAGVYFHPKANKWRARIHANNISISLGLFEKKEDAIQAREIANIKYGFHKNHGKK